ncbi:helix-turn-helix domain-containing protein [Alkalihalobacillus sp. LMS39]|uniref:helix-turn-helix domain-containing protein n=1 Tax=Alkalihalobacillus sp. LMS39 TaxID=2924032 RepID=UPI001FB47157|nr:helix-turn-helix domain-containing protein [Alkalihalobacillus sp. LMS39]UOE92692.1 helix-turn-helix domain-containing protein [Alkalihalobacillus sp. LMS39]
MKLTKREKLLQRLENHLRITARQLVKFDTEEETLQYLIDSFRSELKCDFVGIIREEEYQFSSKVWSGECTFITNHFPMKVRECSPTLLDHSLAFYKVDEETKCKFTRLLIDKKISTWFTVPIRDDNDNYGFCIIGFLNFVPLLEEMDEVFVEFGKDVAIAISLAKRKEVQKQKIIGMEWVSNNLSIATSLDQVIEKVVEGAGRGTGSQFACIYLYDEQENCFVLQPSIFGKAGQIMKIEVEGNYVLKDYFPFLETPGGQQITIPLVIDLKTIGVLHVENKENGFFTKEDCEILELLSSHVATMIENARLYKNEKDHKHRLHNLLDYQQALVKETVENDSFDGITATLSELFSKSVILFDRFMRPISYQLFAFNKEELQSFIDLATIEVFQKRHRELFFSVDEDRKVGVWPVNGGGELLGYLAIDITDEAMDDFYQLSIDLARNISSIQFIKQKLVLDTKEHVKDSFINKLLVETIDNEESIIQYANLFNWNLFNEHRVTVLSINLSDRDEQTNNILEKQAKKSTLWDQIKTRLLIYDQDMIIANKGDENILIVPAVREGTNPKVYWQKLYEEITKWLKVQGDSSQILIGIGGTTNKLSDYYLGYQQAVQALNVVYHRFKDIGFAVFDELGSYTVLHNIKDSSIARLFIDKQLQELLQYSEGKSMDLFRTLRVYLSHNGSIKDTSEELFIHRSSLLYRLEKIQNLLHVNLDSSEDRFDLMMAYKLYDLYYTNKINS